MSVDTPPEPAVSSEPRQVLRREALLPNERSRGLGTVAVVCTMAGVASGLALATTLMAMQVADSMSVRSCPYHVVAAPELQTVELRPQHAFLGIRYMFRDGVTEIDQVLPRTPATEVDLRVGDHVLSYDGEPLHSLGDLQEKIYTSPPGAQPSLVVERDGQVQTLHPTLIAYPPLTY